MKIIQHGKPKVTIRRFQCTECNCIFEADKHEYITGIQYNETYYRCPCPECGKNSTEFSAGELSTGLRSNVWMGRCMTTENLNFATEPRDEIGKLGLYCAPCPACGNQNLVWDCSSDITSCPQCGWANYVQTEGNYRRRFENGEVR